MTDLADLPPALSRRRRSGRDVAEMLGLAKGMLADGVINLDEATYLRDWIKLHPEAASTWPGSAIADRLEAHFRDGHIDDLERLELQQLLTDLTGGQAFVSLGEESPTTLPLCAPAPLICWGPDEVYVFTGRFAYGTRAHCEQEATSRQASVDDNVTRKTTFLVIGTFVTRDWAQTSYGRKIERAVELRSSGFPLRIVSEDHWAASLRRRE